MNNNSRGFISRLGGVMRVDNALVEDVFVQNRTNGFILISYSVSGSNQMTFIEELRLNINRDTVVLNAAGIPMCFCDIRKGMWVDAVFSSAMTRSIPPQSNALLIRARREIHPPMNVTTGRIAFVDTRQNTLTIGNPNDINSQTRFILTDSTVISGRNGNPVSLRSLRPGQRVRVTHANFQTASIPPQTTAFHIQVL